MSLANAGLEATAFLMDVIGKSMSAETPTIIKNFLKTQAFGIEALEVYIDEHPVEAGAAFITGIAAIALLGPSLTAAAASTAFYAAFVEAAGAVTAAAVTDAAITGLIAVGAESLYNGTKATLDLIVDRFGGTFAEDSGNITMNFGQQDTMPNLTYNGSGGTVSLTGALESELVFAPDESVYFSSGAVEFYAPTGTYVDGSGIHFTFHFPNSQAAIFDPTTELWTPFWNEDAEESPFPDGEVPPTAVAEYTTFIRDHYALGGAGGDPLVLDLSSGGTGIDLTALEGSTVHFDLGDDDFAERTAWVGADTGILVRDTNSNGKIDNVTEMFGNDSTAGFTALSALDSNTDGVIDALDTHFTDLKVWVDANGNGVTDAGELKTLSELDIVAINLTTSSVNDDLNGNHIANASTFVRGDTTTGQIAEVSLDRDRVSSVYTGEYAFNPYTLLMPSMRGYGLMPDLYVAMSKDPDLLDMVKDLVDTDIADADTFIQQVTDIIFRWAGVDGVSPTSRVPNIDARMLGAIEMFMGDDNPTYGVNGSSPDVDQVQPLIRAWDGFVIAVASRLLVQGPLASLFPDVTYTYATDSFTGEADLPAAIEALAAVAPVGVEDAARYWGLMGSFFTEIATDLEIEQNTFSSTLQGVFTTAGLPFSAAAVLDNRVVLGTSGNDTLTGNDIADFIFGGDGNDTIKGNENDDMLFGGAGNDTFDGDDGADVIFGGDGTDTLNGGNGADLLNGENGADIINGGAGADTINGGDGNDTIRGGAGADIISGGAGDDTILISSGEVSSGETIDGGADYDKLVLGSTGMNPSTATITNMEELYFDTGVSSVTLNATQFADFDVITNSNGSSSIFNVYAASAGTYSLATKTITGIASLIGSSGNDTLIGSSAGDLLVGGAGVDTIDAGGGNDNIYIYSGDIASGESIDGGSGTDTLVLVNNGMDISAATIANMEGLYFGSGVSSVTLNATQLADFDSIVNSAGSGAGFTLNAASTGTYSLSGKTIVGVATLIGSSGNDTLTGSSGNDIIRGGVGVDTIDGGAGNDTIQIFSGEVPSGETIDGGADYDTLVIGSNNMNPSAATFTNMEELVLSSGVSSLTLSAAQLADFDTITHASGNGTAFTITGSAAGTYSLAGKTINGVLTLVGSSGNDTITGSSGNDIIRGGVGADTINAGAGNDTIQIFSGEVSSGESIDGGADYDTLVIGSNSMNPSSATITNMEELVLSSGVTSLTLSAAQLADFDVITHANGSGAAFTISAVAAGTYSLAGKTITGIATLTGTSGVDTLTGSSGSDTINGGAGNDIIEGGAGDDTLSGGNDIDTLSYASASSAVTVDLSMTMAQITGGAGTDVISGFENITGSAFNDTLTGTSGANVINGGAGANTLNGGAGNDTYILERTYDASTITDNDSTGGNTDVLQLGASIARDQLWFTQSSNDLVIQVIGTNAQMTIKDWYSGSDHQIEQIKTSSNDTLSNANVQNLVSAMAGLTVPATTTLSGSYHTALDSTIAANWT